MDKKEIREQYKTRTVIGGVYAIRNTINNKMFFDSTTDLNSARNRFEFFGNISPKVAADWAAQNGQGFTFEVLEELKKGESQTDQEYKEDLKLLKSIWLEKLAGQYLY